MWTDKQVDKIWESDNYPLFIKCPKSFKLSPEFCFVYQLIYIYLNPDDEETPTDWDASYEPLFNGSDVIAISKDLRYELYKMDNIVVGSRLFLCLLKKEQIIYILKNIPYTKEYVSEVLKTWKDMYNIFGIHKELEELLDQLNIEYQSEYKILRKIL